VRVSHNNEATNRKRNPTIATPNPTSEDVLNKTPMEKLTNANTKRTRPTLSFQNWPVTLIQLAESIRTTRVIFLLRGSASIDGESGASLAKELR
jgi:hypothetical protein